MPKFKLISGVLAIAGLLAAQPCAAQSANAARFERPVSAFAGVNLTLAIDPAIKAKPSVRLQFTADPGSEDGTIPSMDFRPRGLEIGLLETGKPAVFVNGRSAAKVQDELDFGGSGGQTALIVGGVLVAVVVLAVAAGSSGLGDTCPTIEGSRDHCINP